MEEEDQKPNNGRKEASVSLSRGHRGHLPSKSPSPEPNLVADDIVEDTWQWNNGLNRGWMFVPGDSQKSTLPAVQSESQVFVPRLLKGLKGYSTNSMHKTVRMKHNRLQNDVEEVGYSCDDYKRLQSECRALKLQQEKLLERIERTDIEMEHQLRSVLQELEANNSTLKDVAEQLHASQGMIRYLQNIIMTKDLEIERLRKNTTESKPTRQDKVSSPVHSESSVGSMMMVDEGELR